MKDTAAALEALNARGPDRREAAAMLGDLLYGTRLDADTARLVVECLVGLTVNGPPQGSGNPL